MWEANPTHQPTNFLGVSTELGNTYLHTYIYIGFRDKGRE